MKSVLHYIKFIALSVFAQRTLVVLLGLCKFQTFSTGSNEWFAKGSCQEEVA